MTNEIHTMLWEEVIFQLTSSRRGWHGGKKCNLCVYEFQLTSSRRGWQLKLRNNKQIKYFNSHPHEEDDIGSCPICIATRIFQLTSSRRGWPVSLILHHAHTIFQLTSSRRGWHWPDTNTFRTGISTHILTKRMTMTQTGQNSSYRYFNSHPHEEDDLAGNGGIHNELYFNSHPHEEDDRASGNDLCTAKAYFNSHPHEEDDIPNRLVGSLQRHFNSHPHEEDDSVL